MHIFTFGCVGRVALSTSKPTHVWAEDALVTKALQVIRDLFPEGDVDHDYAKQRELVGEILVASREPNTASLSFRLGTLKKRNPSTQNPELKRPSKKPKKSATSAEPAKICFTRGVIGWACEKGFADLIHAA